MSDAEERRRASLASWEAAASGWQRQQALIREFAAPVSRWMIDALAPQPGQRIVELAAGVGETGLLTAELVAPAGTVVISDQAEAMLAAARERAAELGIANVEFQRLDGEWLDLPTASLDGALCRWGYMLMVDPETALRETRRVLRPGARLALAVWDRVEANPWASVPARELIEQGIVAPPTPGGYTPGPFALGDADRLAELIADAGFTEVDVAALDLERRHPDFESFWETTLDFSASCHDTVMELPAERIASVRSGVELRLAPFSDEHGAIVLPARTLVAAASA